MKALPSLQLSFPPSPPSPTLPNHHSSSAQPPPPAPVHPTDPDPPPFPPAALPSVVLHQLSLTSPPHLGAACLRAFSPRLSRGGGWDPSPPHPRGREGSGWSGSLSRPTLTPRATATSQALLSSRWRRGESISSVRPSGQVRRQ